MKIIDRLSRLLGGNVYIIFSDGEEQPWTVEGANFEYANKTLDLALAEAFGHELRSAREDACLDPMNFSRAARIASATEGL